MPRREGVWVLFESGPEMHQLRRYKVRVPRLPLVVLEVLFRDVVDAVSKNETFQLALQNSSLSKSTKRALVEGGVKTSISAVINALQDETFQGAAWEALEIDPEMSFPNLYSDTIYGDLSASIHSPALSEVFVSNLAQFPPFLSSEL